MRWHKTALLILLLTHTALLAYGAFAHSPGADETGHLVAGISHWRFGRFELYRVNPPLVRLVAALPVIPTDAKTDWDGFYESPGARPVFELGREFADINGRDTFRLFGLARWACIPFSLLGALVCYHWARELFGTGSGLLALTLWCFSPNIIAHGQMITPDVGATSLGLLATYSFWRWLRRPGWQRTVITGIVLGLALLTKMTLILLPPALLAIWLVDRMRNRRRDIVQAIRADVRMIVVQVLLVLWIVNCAYGFEGSFTELGDFRFVSKTLHGREEVDVGNRFTGTCLARVPVPLPSDYVLGIDVQKRDCEATSFLSYLRGVIQTHGWWYYYLYALAIKVPLGAWALLMLAVIQRLVQWSPHLALRDALCLVVPPAVILALVSSQTAFNHHMRYVLPIFPFAFIWISQLAVAVNTRRTWSVITVAALLWMVSSSLWIYPHSLAYFNELVGGPRNGHKHLIDSNIDWGQDLLYLKAWLGRHPEASPIRLAYFGNTYPRHAGIEYKLPPRSNEGVRNDSVRLAPGWYAVSVNFLRGYPWHVPTGEGGRRDYLQKDAVSYFQRLKPSALAGYSIYIYFVDEPTQVKCLP